MKVHQIPKPYTYQLGLAKYNGRVGIAEAKRKLKANGLNPNSAADLVYNVSHLLRGKRYKRQLSVRVTDDFLKWITRDHGALGLASALKALGKHIEYYEDLTGSRLPGLRTVLSKHRGRLDTIKRDVTPAISLEWCDRASRGYIDVLPLRLFENLGPKHAVVHEVRSVDGQRYQAKCHIVVHPSSADLDYGAFEGFNAKQDMYIGTARLHFADTDRTAIRKVEWKPQGKSKFEEKPSRTSFEQPADPPYKPPATASGKKTRSVRERKGQAQFRKKLKAVYNGRCCMTGCDVPEVLEGAHIDAYQSEESDNIHNGLLLRRDVHTLFDRDLIAVHPMSFKIQVAKSLQTEKRYGSLHGQKLQLPEDDHRPDTKALKDRWGRFSRAE